MFNIKDVLELNDKKQYVVVSKTKYNEEDYIFIAEISNKNNIKFCRVINNDNTTNLAVVKDDELIKELIPLLTDSLDKFAEE